MMSVNPKIIYFYHTRDDAQSDVGGRAVIERFGKVADRTKFAPPQIRADLLGLDRNNFRHAFVVDVRVEAID